MASDPTPEEMIKAMYPSFLAPYGESLLDVVNAEKKERRAAVDGDYDARRKATFDVEMAKERSYWLGRETGAAILRGLRMAMEFHPEQTKALIIDALGITEQLDEIRAEIDTLSGALATCEDRINKTEARR